MSDRHPDDPFDERLRSAARLLASEPLPDGILDSELGATSVGRRWVPALAGLSLGVATVALTFGSLRIGQLGQPSPTPSVVSSEPSPSVASQATPGPTIWPEYYLYAEEYGVSIEETLRRMQIMEEFDSVPLREAVGSRWAGGWTEHAPEFRYVVRLTGHGAVGEFEALTAGWPLPVVFITGANHSESEMLAAMERIQDRIYEELPRTGYGPDLHTGTIVLMGPDRPSAELLAELEALGGVPVRYEYSPGEFLLEGSPAP